jgi:hypothetical protein
MAPQKTPIRMLPPGKHFFKSLTCIIDSGSKPALLSAQIPDLVAYTIPRILKAAPSRRSALSCAGSKFFASPSSRSPIGNSRSRAPSGFPPHPNYWALFFLSVPPMKRPEHGETQFIQPEAHVLEDIETIEDRSGDHT